MNWHRQVGICLPQAVAINSKLIYSVHDLGFGRMGPK